MLNRYYEIYRVMNAVEDNRDVVIFVNRCVRH